MIIYIEWKKEDIINLILGWRICSNCNANFNVYKINGKPSKFMPKVEGKCDYCESELKTREDDNAKTINKRFDTFT